MVAMAEAGEANLPARRSTFGAASRPARSRRALRLQSDQQQECVRTPQYPAWPRGSQLSRDGGSVVMVVAVIVAAVVVMVVEAAV